MAKFSLHDDKAQLVLWQMEERRLLIILADSHRIANRNSFYHSTNLSLSSSNRILSPLGHTVQVATGKVSG